MVSGSSMRHQTDYSDTGPTICSLDTLVILVSININITNTSVLDLLHLKFVTSLLLFVSTNDKYIDL